MKKTILSGVATCLVLVPVLLVVRAKAKPLPETSDLIMLDASDDFNAVVNEVMTAGGGPSTEMVASHSEQATNSGSVTMVCDLPYVSASVHVHQTTTGSTYYWRRTVWDGDNLVASTLSSGFTVPNGSTTTNMDGSTETDFTYLETVTGLDSGTYDIVLTLMQVQSPFTSGYTLNSAPAEAAFACWHKTFADVEVP